MGSTVCGSLAAALLEGVPLPESFSAAFMGVLPGATCFSVALVHGSAEVLRPVVVMEAGSLQWGQLTPGEPQGEGTALWTAYSTGTVLCAYASCDGKLEYTDWKQLYEKYGVSVFVTAPLVAPDGVLGSLCVAGGVGCAGKRVKGGTGGVQASNVRLIAELLAESLLRRTADMLLDVRLTKL